MYVNDNMISSPFISVHVEFAYHSMTAISYEVVSLAATSYFSLRVCHVGGEK